jgi:hypothetical protein
MKPWKQFVLLNLAAAAGVFCSLFVVPENTTLKLWAVVSLAVMLVLNIGLYLRQHSKGHTARLGGTAMVWFGFALFIIDIVFSHYFR